MSACAAEATNEKEVRVLSTGARESRATCAKQGRATLVYCQYRSIGKVSEIFGVGKSDHSRVREQFPSADSLTCNSAVKVLFGKIRMVLGL